MQIDLFWAPLDRAATECLFFFLGETQHASNANNIRNMTMDLSTIYHCQTGVLTPFDLYEHALYIIGISSFEIFERDKNR